MDSLQSAAQKRETTVEQAVNATQHAAPVLESVQSTPPSGEPTSNTFTGEDGTARRYFGPGMPVGSTPIKPR